MELFVFARFHARSGNESDVIEALHDVIVPTREEPGCLSIHAYRSVRESQLFYITCLSKIPPGAHGGC